MTYAEITVRLMQVSKGTQQEMCCNRSFSTLYWARNIGESFRPKIDGWEKIWAFVDEIFVAEVNLGESQNVIEELENLKQNCLHIKLKKRRSWLTSKD